MKTNPVLLTLLIAACSTSTYAQKVDVISNGYVHSNPAYPYQGHGYYYDTQPGDNDMPWLRQFATNRGIFRGLNMSAAWKNRELKMMKKIIYFTSHTMHWSDNDTVTPSDSRRAKSLLQLATDHPDYLWGCGSVAYAAIGLAQAHGIPARAVNAYNEFPPNGGDYCVEFFSTQYNRWIWFCPKTYAWIEHPVLGPLGMRDLHSYYVNGMLDAEYVNDGWYPAEGSTLLFMPNPRNVAPIEPYYSAWWWDGYWRYCAYTHKVQPNGSAPVGHELTYHPNHQWVVDYYTQLWGYYPGGEIVALDDLDANYPLNNVEAEVSLTADGVLITLENNMFQFQRYEYRVEDSTGTTPWVLIDLSRPNPMRPTYLWQPLVDSTLSIRGVNEAGVHSPDVVIRYLDRAEGGTLDGDAPLSSHNMAKSVEMDPNNTDD